MKKFKCRIKVKVNRKSLYDLFKDKPIPKNLSVDDIEWEVVPSDGSGSKIRQILYAVYDRIIHTHTYFSALMLSLLRTILVNSGSHSRFYKIFPSFEFG